VDVVILVPGRTQVLPMNEASDDRAWAGASDRYTGLVYFETALTSGQVNR
jgi:hypothetical protein